MIIGDYLDLFSLWYSMKGLKTSNFPPMKTVLIALIYCRNYKFHVI